MLSVPKGDFKGPFNAPTQWETSEQSQSEHLIPIQKQMPKRGSNMHEIKKIRPLCLVNFLMKFKKMQPFFHFEHD